MKRTILLIAMLAMTSIMVHGQQASRLLIEKDGIEWLRVDSQGKYHYAPGLNAERIINEMAALGAKQLPSLTPGASGVTFVSYGLVISLSTPERKYAHAQQQPKPIAEIKPEVGVKMPPEYAEQLLSKFQESKKLQDDNAQLIQAWQNYLAKQNAIQSQADIIIVRGAMAAKLSVDQLDHSDLVPDGKSGFQWVEKVKVKK